MTKFNPASIHLILTAMFTAATAACTSCTGNDRTWYEDDVQLWEDYLAAVEQAKEPASPEKMDPDLVSVISPEANPLAEWLVQDGRTFVLVGSVMTADESLYWAGNGTLTDITTSGQGASYTSGNTTDTTAFVLDDRFPWVTLPYDLRGHLEAAGLTETDGGLEMRIIQMLGLPPDCNCDRIVLFWAEKDSLFRPAPDPEIYDSEVLTDFREDVDPRYRAWFEDYWKTAYESEPPYPWTRMGYTYDWHAGASTVMGPSEFVVRPGAMVIVRDILPVRDWYGRQEPPSDTSKN